MNFKCLNILFVFLLSFCSTLSAQGWLGKDLANMGDINVKQLTDAQRKEVLNAANAQGLNVSDLEFLLKSRGLSAPDVREMEAGEAKVKDTVEEIDALTSSRAFLNRSGSSILVS